LKIKPILCCILSVYLLVAAQQAWANRMCTDFFSFQSAKTPSVFELNYRPTSESSSYDDAPAGRYYYVDQVSAKRTSTLNINPNVLKYLKKQNLSKFNLFFTESNSFEAFYSPKEERFNRFFAEHARSEKVKPSLVITKRAQVSTLEHELQHYKDDQAGLRKKLQDSVGRLMSRYPRKAKYLTDLVRYVLEQRAYAKELLFLYSQKDVEDVENAFELAKRELNQLNTHFLLQLEKPDPQLVKAVDKIIRDNIIQGTDIDVVFLGS